MKKLVIQLFVGIFLLCCGFQAVAQTPITEYKEKLNSLSDDNPHILDGIINGAPSMLFINAEEMPGDYRGSGMPYKMMMLHEPSDLMPLLNAYEGQLDGLQVINIEWKGEEQYLFPINTLSKLPGLKYVYIRSEQQLTKQVVESSFPELIKMLEGQDQVEILYFTMEKPG